MSDKQYAKRDPMALDKQGGYYIRHVMALTREELHAKSAIAAELAWRDAEIDRLKAQAEVATGSVALPELDAAVAAVMGLVAILRQEALKVTGEGVALANVQTVQDAIESKVRALLAGVSVPAATGEPT